MFSLNYGYNNDRYADMWLAALHYIENQTTITKKV